MSEAATEPQAPSLIHPDGIHDPLTGAVVSPEAETAELLRLREEGLRAMEEACKEARRAVDLELLARMDRGARWTLREGEFEATGTSPAVVEYDTDRLRAEINGLVRSGVIDKDARAAALKPTVGIKVDKRGVQAIAKTSDQAAAAIAQAEKEATRRVTVKRKGGA